MYVKTVHQGNGGPVHVYVVVVILQIRSIIISISCEITFLLYIFIVYKSQGFIDTVKFCTNASMTTAVEEIA